MSVELLVNVGADETRVALVEDGIAREVHVERGGRHGLVGNIYKGVVKRVLPGMQAAFIDIGLERTAFLHVADMQHSCSGEPPPPPPIGSLLSEGSEVLVQVLKDPIGTKGARLTTILSLPSRYLVLIPGEAHVGVSARIEDEAERERLHAVLEKIAADGHPPAPIGIIARTAAEGVEAAALAADLQFLLRLWDVVAHNAAECHDIQLVHGDLPLSLRMLRDLLGTAIDRVRIDDAAECRRASEFARGFIPELTERIEVHAGPVPIFDLYSVEDTLNHALERRVPLKCGGYLIIDQTEAMTTIDVNTGAFTGHSCLDDTIFKANVDATAAIAHQLRLRNLGGIVIIDFIDMKNEDHRAQVLRALEKELAHDPARTHVYPFSPLGLVEMTRKRTRESLGHILCEPCPTCNGRGTIKSVETLCREVERELQRASRRFDTNRFLVLAAPSIVTRLQEGSDALNRIVDGLNRSIKLQAEPHYPQELFDVVPL
ncbi:MAG: ribonuclease G [Nevskiaceae bacterium]|nr:MAG: ribonuclease G [Nevskiaceae bacterium]TBR72750.1 MAG: ribonuclease G [Nevskiaceae bacterium]